MKDKDKEKIIEEEKMQKNEVDGGLAGLVGVGWQRKRRK